MRIIVFDNDSEFEEFAINDTLYYKMSGDHAYYDWDFSGDYLAELEKNTLFFIKDKNSDIVRRDACTFNIISKPVKNVKRYNAALAESNNPNIEIVEYKNYYENID